MANFRIAAAALVALVSLLPAQENAPSTAGAKPVDAAVRGRSPTIGVVDLDKARDQYPKAIAEREKLQKLSQSFNESINAETKRIDEIKAGMALIKEGTDEREAREAELGLALERRKVMASLFRSQFERARDKFDLAIYQDFEVAIAQVAKDRGVQIVLRVHEAPAVAEGGKESAEVQQARLFTYNRRNVWFATDEVDLTGALIKYLQGPLDLDKGEPKKTEAGKTESPAAPKPAGNGGL